MIDPAHYTGLWRAGTTPEDPAPSQTLAFLGRRLDEYAAVIRGGER